MILARAAGQVVGTQRADGIEAGVYLLLEEYSAGMKATGRFLVALDLLGTGEGEVVIVSQGSSVRQTEHTKNKAVDAVIVGIVDEIDSVDDVVYRKNES